VVKVSEFLKFGSGLLHAACTAALLLAWVLDAGPAGAEVAVMQASSDATLIERADGEIANGAGPALFVGRNSGSTDSVRRALLAFDVAAAVPAGAWVTHVALELELTRSNNAVIGVGLHRVLAPWSEGPAASSGGGGALAEPGDVTWIHRSYDSEYWGEPGGDFEPISSADALVGGAGIYVWSSTPDLVADVRDWLDDPESNHGWVLVGGEGAPQTAKRFASREAAIESARPRLIVEYATSCDDFPLAGGALGLCRAYCEVVGCSSSNPRGSDRTCDALARSYARRTGGAAPPCEIPDP
jgi:hypothetical protein